MADAPTAWASRRYRPVDYDRGPGRRRTGVRVLADACWRRRMAPMQAADRRWDLVDCRARWRRRAVRVPRQDEFHRNAMPVRVERSVAARSEEHTSELQSLMRISSAVFCFTKKTNT